MTSISGTVTKLVLFRPWLYLADLISWIGVYCMPMIPGLLMKWFFDTLGGVNHYGLSLAHLLALLSVTALANAGVILNGGSVDIRHRYTMSALLRHNLAVKMLKRYGVHVTAVSPGDGVSRFRDDVESVEDLISWCLDVAGNLVFGIVSLAVMAFIDVKVTILVFVPLTLVISLVRTLSAKVESYRTKSRDATAKVTEAIGEIFQAVQSIKVAAAETSIVHRFGNLSEIRRRAVMKERALNIAMDSMFGNTIAIGTGLILLAASNSLSKGKMSVGDFALFAYYLNHFADLTGLIGNFLNHVKQTKISLTRLAELAGTVDSQELADHTDVSLLPTKNHTDVCSYSASIDPITDKNENLSILVANRLSYTHSSSEKGIQDISIAITKGTLNVITGKIGCGKTTLLRVLLGLLPAESGSISWNDQLVSEPSTFMVPPRTAYVPQIPVLFSDTLKENITLGATIDTSSILEALRLATFDDDLSHMRLGLDTLVGSRGVRLSGGQVQRVAAARAISRMPQLLVADDLSSALDVETEQRLWDRLLTGEGSHNTYLAVTHRRSLLARAHQILLLDEGKLVGTGSLSELLESSELMRYLWQVEKG